LYHNALKNKVKVILIVKEMQENRNEIMGKQRSPFKASIRTSVFLP
jgi:hypothetical protein